MSVTAFILSEFQQKRWFRLAALAGLILWAILLTGLFFSTQPTTGLFTDNQSTYFVQGLRLSGQHPYLENDWFAQTKPLHIAFTWLVAGLTRLGVLAPAARVLDVLFRLVFLLSLGLMTNALLTLAIPEDNPDPLKRGGLVLSVISIYILSLWPVFQLSAISEQLGISSLAIAFEKFGFYYSWGGFAAFRYYTEPASFSVLILTAIALMPYKRWRWSAALLGIAGLMHASFLIHSGVIAGILALYLFLRKERKEALIVIGIYAFIVLPLVIYILTQMTDAQSGTANLILALERVPHHTQPSRWWNSTDSVHLGVILVGSAVLWWKDRGPTRWTVLAITLYAGLSILLVLWMKDNASLAILMPWRASGYLYAVCQLVVLTAGLTLLINLLGRWPHFAVLITIIIPLVFLIWGAVENGIFSVLAEEYEDTTTQENYPFMLQIQEKTPEDAVLLIPLNEGDYRLGAQRPIYVDWKSHPYKGEEVMEWWDRVNFVRNFYILGAPDRLQACHQAEADFYVVTTGQHQPIEPATTSWGDWVLVPCPIP